MEKRKKIAVFSSNIYEPMVHAITQGINKAALETGVKIIYFTSFSDSFSNKIYEQYLLYDEGDVVCFELPDLDEFDGIIRIDLSYGIFAKKHLDERLANTKVPIINVGGKDDRYLNVLNDEDEAFGNVVEHLISVHNCKNIYHIAGLKHKPFTQQRISAFQAVMQKHSLPCDDSKIYYGTLWRDCGEPAMDYILADCEKNGVKYPDAIVCANDYTAIGVVNACRARGIEVPGDILVTGYDGVEEAFQGYPSITTGAQPFFESGYETVYAFKRMWAGEKIESAILTHGSLKCNQSCGCAPMKTDFVEDIRETFSSRLGNVIYLAQSTTNLILSVSNAQSIEECFNEIAKNAALDTGFETMLLCLAPGWDKKRIIASGFSKQDEEMAVVAGFIGSLPAKLETFRKKDLLPPSMLNDPRPYCIFTIHHLQYYMGYLIVSPTEQSHEQLAMKSWLVNLGSMLENWRIRHELHLAVDRLENLYNRDVLTNLYNRHGYEMFFSDFFRECRDKRIPLGVLVIDMDDLKSVNDHYGHAEGDYSLCTIAEAMNVAAKNGEICLRTGGDEFVVLAKDYSDAKALAYANALRDHITTRVTRDKKTFDVKVSIGACVKLPPEPSGSVYEDESIIRELSEEYMKIADAAMYEEKKMHKGKS
ncbi:MAG: GGDEF domain-containing protein [Clostridiales bacterium]|nr:GGDEF domain-containing protein [Clostridiales bacterium]